MGKSLADNSFITEMKDKNGDSWYHQIVLEAKDKEIEKLNNIINKAIKYIEDGETNYNSNWLSKGREDLLNILKKGDKVGR